MPLQFAYQPQNQLIEMTSILESGINAARGPLQATFLGSPRGPEARLWEDGTAAGEGESEASRLGGAFPA